MSDTPKIDLVLADLEKEIHKPEPFTVVLGGGKRVTFKDPFAFKMSERKELFELHAAAQRGEVDDLEFLKRIMSAADFKKYEEADLPIRTHEALSQRVMAHFEGNLGSAGEDTASKG